MKLRKGFPRFQTVKWWKEQLEEFDDKAIVLLLTAPGAEPKAMASLYTKDDDAKYVLMDVE